jgi:hypothetical protein
MGLLDKWYTTWASIFSLPVIKFFAPFGDFTAFAIIILQMLWTFIIYNFDLWTYEEGDLPFDAGLVTGVLLGSLSFLLPLKMSGALGKNADCLNNYNAFTGDVMAYGWQIIALQDPTEGIDSDSDKRKIFDILIALPAITKHSFRGTVDLEYATTRASNKPFKETTAGGKIVEIVGDGNGMNAVEACFYKLLDYQRNLADGKPTIWAGAATKSWERAYGSYGNMANLNAYIPPVLFTYVLQTALYLYVGLLPFTLKSQGVHAIWESGLVAYFFIGLNLAGSKVGNAFAENAAGSFQTVSPAQKAATKSMIQVYARRDGINASPSASADAVVNISSKPASYISPFKF